MLRYNKSPLYQFRRLTSNTVQNYRNTKYDGPAILVLFWNSLRSVVCINVRHYQLKNALQFIDGSTNLSQRSNSFSTIPLSQINVLHGKSTLH